MRNNEGVNGRFPDFSGYLLVVFLAKSTQMFRLSGMEIDNSIYFTFYQLWNVVKSLKDPITHVRTKAIKIYTMLSKDGLVDIKKIDGDTYVLLKREMIRRNNHSLLIANIFGGGVKKMLKILTNMSLKISSGVKR
jgi:hypothetical protein